MNSEQGRLDQALPELVPRGEARLKFFPEVRFKGGHNNPAIKLAIDVVACQSAAERAILCRN